MASPIDPSFVKMMTPDFSTFNEGVKSAGEFAIMKAKLDSEKLLAGVRAEEIAQQRELNRMQKVLKVTEGLNDALSHTGKVRKARLSLVQYNAALMGFSLPPDLMAAFEDDSYADVLRNALGNVLSGKASPEDLGTLGTSLPLDQLMKLAGEGTRRKNVDSQAQRREDQTDLDQQAQDLDEAELDEKVRSNKEQERIEWAKLQAKKAAQKASSGGSNSKLAKELRSTAFKVQKEYDPLINKPSAIIALLDEKTAAGDEAAKQQFVRFLSKDRVTEGEMGRMSSMGNIMDKVEAIFNKNFVAGQTYNDTVRNQIKSTLKELQGGFVREYRGLLEPTYNTALNNGLEEQIRKGEILNETALKLFGVDAAEAPSRKAMDKMRAKAEGKASGSADSSESKKAEPAKQEAAAKKPQGLSAKGREVALKAINAGLTYEKVVKGFKARGATPPTPAEFKQLMKEAGK